MRRCTGWGFYRHCLLKKNNFPYMLTRPAAFGRDINYVEICIGLTPTLTTIDYRDEEVGRCLALELLALIEGKVSSIQTAIRPFLVERESHGPNGMPDV